MSLILLLIIKVRPHILLFTEKKLKKKWYSPNTYTKCWHFLWISFHFHIWNKKLTQVSGQHRTFWSLRHLHKNKLAEWEPNSRQHVVAWIRESRRSIYPVKWTNAHNLPSILPILLAMVRQFWIVTSRKVYATFITNMFQYSLCM